MRFAPTSALCTIAAIFALVGCASSENAEEPTSVPETTESTAAQERKPDDAKKTTTGDRPDFAPQFENTTAPEQKDEKKGDATPEAGGAQQCKDDDDAPGTPALAKKLPETDDCNQDMISVSGVMNGGVDADYYSLSATDKGISFSHPIGCKKDSAFETKTAGTEICVFARCKNTTENTVNGCLEGTEATSENGWKGCCGAKAVPDLDCSGFTDNDSADFLIRIKQTNNANACLPYKFEYRF